MDPMSILLPFSALALLTLTVLLLVPYRRFKATAAKEVTVDDFRMGESSNVPERVSLPNRNVMNLTEIPILFYALCLALFVSGTVTPFFVNMAWLYVVLRIGHSIVHVSYNNIMHRLGFFATSNLVLLIMWIRFVIVLH